jgi:hypothetical protein
MTRAEARRREEQQASLQVACGEWPWTDLGGLGISVRLEGDRCNIENPCHLAAIAGRAD